MAHGANRPHPIVVVTYSTVTHSPRIRATAALASQCGARLLPPPDAYPCVA
jgi:hypothetical protein